MKKIKTFLSGDEDRKNNKKARVPLRIITLTSFYFFLYPKTKCILLLLVYTLNFRVKLSGQMFLNTIIRVPVKDLYNMQTRIPDKKNKTI